MVIAFFTQEALEAVMARMRKDTKGEENSTMQKVLHRNESLKHWPISGIKAKRPVIDTGQGESMLILLFSCLWQRLYEEESGGKLEGE